MPRSPSTYSLPPGTTPQQPNTVISSSMFNAFADDVAQTFNTVQPIVYGGTGSNDLKLTDTDFGIKDNSDPTKIGQFNASNIPTATTRTYDLPYYSGTLGLVSDIRGQIYGLTLSNNAVDIVNDIDIAAGSAVDSTGTVSMLLSSSLTKRLDAAWAVGSGNGWLDTGAIANTTYHVFLIRRPDTGVVDSLASASPTAPTLPTNYTQFRRIGSIVRASGAIRPFVQNENVFIYTTVITDRNSTAAAASALFTLSVPTGIIVRPLIGTSLTVATNADASNLFGSAATGSANIVTHRLGNLSSSTLTTALVDYFATNTSAQLYFSCVIATGSITANTISTFGYIDSRGQF